MLDAIRSLLPGDGGRTVVRECRNCGRSIESDLENCPCCGHDEVARYEID